MRYGMAGTVRFGRRGKLWLGKVRYGRHGMAGLGSAW